MISVQLEMKPFLYILSLTAIYSYTVSAASDQLPDGIPKCSQNDANISECIKNSVQTMLPRLKNGNKELNIPPIDPFHLDKNTYQYSDGVVNGRISIKNTKIFGLSDAVIKEVDFSLKDGYIRYTSFNPKVFAEGLYKGQLKINNLNLTPKGYFNVSISDTLSNIKIKLDPIDKDGVRFLQASSFEIAPEVGDVKFYASGIFADQALNDLALEFINQSWREIFKSILPVTRDYYEPLVIAITNDFLKTFPLDVLLPKN